MLSWRIADATHTMPRTSRARSNSSTTASYTRAMTPWTNKADHVHIQMLFIKRKSNLEQFVKGATTRHLFGPCKSLRLREEVGERHEEHQGQVGEKENQVPQA